MPNELKPCPLCNSDAEMHFDKLAGKTIYMIKCSVETCQCQEMGWHEDQSKAAIVWNTRPIEDKLTAELEIAKKALELATKKDADTKEILDLLTEHLDYCGWGDAWERECAEPTQKALSDYMERYYPAPPTPSIKHYKSYRKGGVGLEAERIYPAWNKYAYGDKSIWTDSRKRAAKHFGLSNYKEVKCEIASTKKEQLNITYFREDVYEMAGE